MSVAGLQFSRSMPEVSPPVRPERDLITIHNRVEWESVLCG